MESNPADKLPTWVRVVLALGALLAVTGVGLDIAVDDGHKERSISVRVDGRDRDRKADDTLTVPADAPGAKAGPEAAREVPEAKDNMRTEVPPGLPKGAADFAREQQEELAQNDNLPIVQPDAAPEQRGCSSRFVANKSSRRGVKPRLWVAHYTVSGNLPGLADLLGLTALSNRLSSQVSWSYNIDRDGNCFYTVRESDKPWTNTTMNPVSITAEFVNTGHEFPFLKAEGFAKAGLVISDSTKRWAIPLQVGAINTSRCTVTRPGIVDHHMLGPCGGGHVDIAPPFSVQALVNAAIKARGQSTPPKRLPNTLNAAQRHTCDVLNFHRHRAHVVGKWYPSRAKRARQLKAKLPTGTCPNKYATR